MRAAPEAQRSAASSGRICEIGWPEFTPVEDEITLTKVVRDIVAENRVAELRGFIHHRFCVKDRP